MYRYKVGAMNTRYCVILKVTMALGWTIPAIYALVVSVLYKVGKYHPANPPPAPLSSVAFDKIVQNLTILLP